MDTKKIIQYNECNEQSKSDELFSTRKPKDVVAGISSGIKNTVKGVLGGAIGLVAMPILCAKDEGPVGFFKGLGTGLIGAVVLPVAGTVTGSMQVVRGLINTPYAIKAKSDGKIWSEDKKKWINYNLLKDSAEIMTETEAGFLAKLPKKNYINRNEQFDKKVKDDYYYKVLEIPIDASYDDIKKSYRELARKYHPDKYHEDDGEKFKIIGEAYQILSDPMLRNEYNKKGREGVSNKAIYNPKDLYIILFGNDDLYFYIGEFLFSMIVSLEKEQPIELIKFKQMRREIIVANNIVNLLNPYMNEDDYINFYNHTKNSLGNEPIIKNIISLVGKIYVESAKLYLGNVESIGVSMKKFKRDWINKFNITKNIIGAASNNEDSTKNLLIDTLIMDIESVVSNACFKVLNDSSVSLAKRQKRANGLIFIGKLFSQEKSDKNVIRDSFKSKFNQ